MQLAPELEDWPFAPEEGPFHVKGVAYSFHMDYVETQLPGGVEAQAEALESDAFRDFFGQTFYATNWYDLYPLVVAGYACGEVAGLGFDEFVRRRTEHQAALDLGLIRRTLARVMSATYLANRVPQINASYFDFVKAESRTADQTAVEGKCCGIPAAYLRWYQIVTETFVAEVLTRGGTPSARFFWKAPMPSGEAHGLPLFDMSYMIRWG